LHVGEDPEAVTASERAARTPAGARRLAVARRVAAGYAAQPEVAAVLCTGSTARDQADRWSDLELAVVWAAPPTEAQRRAAIAAAGGRDARLWPRDEAYRMWEDAWWDGGPAGHGLLLEVDHSLVEDVEAQLTALLRPDPRTELLAFGDAFANGLPLAGEERLAGWRDRLTPYPRPLAAAAVRRHGQIDHFWRWQMYAERQDGLQLRAHFAGVAERVVHVACALSGVWWPGTKRLPQTAAGLAVAPAGLAGRLRAVSHLSPPAAAAALTALVEESYELIALHLPEVDTERLRAIFRFARRPW
jgi:hypothetical protein